MSIQPFVPSRDANGRFAETERPEQATTALVDASVVEGRLNAAYDIIASGEFEAWNGVTPQKRHVSGDEVRAGLRARFDRLDDATFARHVTPVLDALAKMNELNEESADNIARWDHLRTEAGVEFEDSSAIVSYAALDQPAREDDLETAYMQTYGVFEELLVAATEALEAADRAA